MGCTSSRENENYPDFDNISDNRLIHIGRDWRYINRDKDRDNDVDDDDEDDDEDDTDDDDIDIESYVEDPMQSGLKYLTVDFRKDRRKTVQKTRPFVPEGMKWTDPDFPLSVAIREYVDKSIYWKRPEEIVSKPVLFSESTSRFDIQQRNFGTCWFLSMMSNLAEKPELCMKVINEDSYTPESDGVCHCRLWRFGEWEQVYMDDHLPVKMNSMGNYWFYGALSGTDRNELWVPLLEKALARLHGSYNTVSDEGGYPSDAYITLTGGVAERISLRDKLSNPSPLFRRIRNALTSGALITCAVPSKYDGHIGLVGGHAYSLTGAEQVTLNNGERVALIRIRNPHGTNEWEGNWSDRSSDWNDVKEGKQLLNERNDGEFWISLHDFLRYFISTTICALSPDFDVDGCLDALNYVLRIFGEWQGKRAVGEGRSLRRRLRNPGFEFTVPEEGSGDQTYIPIVIQLIQNAQHLDYDDIRCDLYMIRSEDPSSRTVVVYKVDDMEGKDYFFPCLQCCFRFRLRPGRYIAIPTTKDKRVFKEFLIRVFSPCPLKNIRSGPRRLSLIR